ncbi:MAG TPA: TlpA disulfide reductase family protein [Candidatus Methylomirabilis sp.]|nr:TlpA disulfide reductase family protein [Candidatus Methylomirabilis sp.]
MAATLKNLLLLAVAVLALAGGYWTAQTLRPAVPVKETTPSYGGGAMIDFSLPDLTGKKHSLSEWRGKVIVLNFWATWCPPCREEIPLFIALQKRYGSGGVQLLGVATADDKESVIAYRQSAGMNYPILIGDDDAMDIMVHYGNRQGSIPYTVIIDREGGIVARKLGAFDQADLMRVIAPLLPPSGTPSSPPV